MTPEDRISRELAKTVCTRIARQTRLALQKMTDCRLSGDNSVLANIWDELCVQLQSEEFFAWSAYEETVTAFVAGTVAELRRHEAEAIYLQTDHYFNNPPKDESAGIPIYEPAMVDMIIKDYVYQDAQN